jgi:ATP-dependent protease ClpP protease subunit
MSTPTYNIDIDSYIGNWGYSQNYVRGKLNDLKNQPVFMRSNSLGGNVNDGLGIYQAIGDHGDVQVDMYGFNASTATWMNLKAKRVRIASNGFYLIHKSMNAVEIYKAMNADELAVLIEELKVNLDENNKVDEVIAQMYVSKTGKSMTEILDLMKIGGWMNSSEALSWGFVDEIIPTIEKINMAGLKDKFNALGMPTNRINSEDLFTQKTNIKMKKQPIKINAVLNVPSLESADGGVFLNEAQIESIETKLATQEADIATEKANVVTEKEATTAAVTRANTAEGTVATQATKITELEAQVENLKTGAGASTKKVNKETDEDGEGDEKGKDEFMNTVTRARKMFDSIS